MSSAVVDGAASLSSSMSSSYHSPATSPPPSEEQDHPQKSPAMSFADTNASNASPGGPGGEGGNKDRHTAGPATTTARARANAGAASTTTTTPTSTTTNTTTTAPANATSGINNANVNVRSRAGAGGPVEKPLSAANVTPKRPMREPLQQQHFDAADENHFGSESAHKLMRSDTAPSSGRNVFLSAAAAVRNQQSPQQLQKAKQHVQAGLWADQLARRCFMCPTCMNVVNDPVLLVGDRKMVCRKCVPQPRPSGGVAELPVNLLEAIKEVYAVGDVKHISSSSGTANPSGMVDEDKPTATTTNHGSRRGSNSGTLANSRNANTTGTDPQKEPVEDDKDVSESNGKSHRAAGTEKANTTAGARGPRGSGNRPTGPTSRQYKIEADQKYESAEYTASLELYSKAIQMQPLDGLTQLRYLYGNRSAAHFMAQRYGECVADCLEVVKLEPNNVKMISRAARSAATMGDLKQAISILESTSPKSLSETMAAELAKYKTGLDLYQKAENGFGTPDGDERYRMLVAQFSETVPFRIRYAESLMQQRQYVRAAETLEVTSSLSRPPKLCRLLAECLYQSGFERFEAARRVLRDVVQIDEECDALAKLIEIVDEGKQKGNANFTEKRFAAAVEHYTSAISSARGNEQILRILYCNRAAANKELGRYREGVEDCTKAIALDKDFYKAYARRARCHQNLGDHFAAVQDFRRAVEFDRSDKELAKELRQAEYNLQKEAEREKDYYYQLGLTSTASEKEIKVKYRELSLRWHPDKCVSMDPMEKERAEHKFKVISESYANLIDPAKRREYDAKTSRSVFGGRPGGFSSTYSSYNTTDTFRGRARGAPGSYW